MPATLDTPRTDFRLARALRRVVAEMRAIRLHRGGTLLWLTVTAVGGILAIGQRTTPWLQAYAAPALLPVFVAAAGLGLWLAWRGRVQLSDAAREVERRYPELGTALQAAVEQQPDSDGRFHFLQRRVIDSAMAHADIHDWSGRLRAIARLWLLAHVAAMTAAVLCSYFVVREHRPAGAADGGTFGVRPIEVTPGTAEVERGATVVIAARFSGALPREAILVWQPDGAAEQRSAMHRSLSDPVFAFTLPSVRERIVYRVEHDGERTAVFTLTVFDRPALVRADAALDFPEYTGLADRRVVDTRRVSAVVGTGLIYEFAMNKPLVRAVLHDENKVEIPLEAAAEDRTRFRWQTTIQRSQRFTLHLADEAGRTNPAPIDLRIEALENRRPEVKLTFPGGDLRVSPLEELQLQAEARDDFGLRDYGMGLSLADGAPEYVSLAPQEAGPTVQASLRHALSLETRGVKPDQLVTWFAWADDVGPDGAVRRTSSDIFFAEVRRLEEIFREEANAGGSPPAAGGAGGPGEELVETQRQISIAIWKLRQQDADLPAFAGDAATLRDSQQQVREQLATMRERLDDARARAAADEAVPHMNKAEEELDRAASGPSTDPLASAWAGARDAYQALLRMQPRESRVAQSQGNSGGGSSRGREQLNELEFRHEQDRYETETQAQAAPTPEEREQLQVLARLRELARRQQDLNARLQELQTALAAAEDETQREEIRREFKRLEDEQRRMLADVDETRQRVDRLQPGERTREARRQLEQTREDMRRAGEQLAQGEVSQALAAGTRAGESLQKTSDDLRREAAGRFGEQMGEARRQARELAREQQAAAKAVEELNDARPSLDDSKEREALAQRLEDQAQRREALLEGLRQITEESETAEPRLHRQLYDVLRQQGQSGAREQLSTSAELLRRGFVDPVREPQEALTREFDQLQRAVERASNAVLGDETNELRFAHNELEALAEELRRERGTAGAETGPEGEQPPPQPGELSEGGLPRPDQSENRLSRSETSGPDEPSDSRASGPPTEQTRGTDTAGEGDSPEPRPGEAGAGAGGELGELEQLARQFGESQRASDASRGPLTGGNFADWNERLRTVEELMEDPGLRERIGLARAGAEEVRREFERHGKPPEWGLVELDIVNPLQEASAWLRQEVRRREEPDALQPVDRDPVPERYAESVRKYYEALGAQ